MVHVVSKNKNSHKINYNSSVKEAQSWPESKCKEKLLMKCGDSVCNMNSTVDQAIVDKIADLM